MPLIYLCGVKYDCTHTKYFQVFGLFIGLSQNAGRHSCIFVFI